MSSFHGNNAQARTWRALIFSLCALLGGIFASTAMADEFEDGKLRFGIPPWPGLTIKAAIAVDILETLGYETEQQNVGTALALQGLADKNIDVFMGNWTPNQDEMVGEFLDQGKVEVLATNVDDAAWGIAVPPYVWEAGVTSVSDLDEYRDRFGGRIHGIEEGSALNKNFQDAIEQDAAGLGDWDLVASSTAGMLMAVERAVGNGTWIAWGAWSPHWMMEAYDARILDNPTEAILANTVRIRTLTPAGFRQAHENASRFLERFQVPSATQSAWIYEFDREERAKEDVASEWIRNNRDLVAEWLQGVSTRDGRAAVEVFREQY